MKAWLDRRRKLLAQLKKQVALRMGPVDRELEVYHRAFEKEFEGLWEPCLKSEMIEELHTGPIVLGSDFHAFPQSQRTHLRIMRELKVPFTLALECFDSRYQSVLENYMSGMESDEAFLAEVKWDENWGFPWWHYKILVDFARVHSLPVLAINNLRLEGKNLGGRDRFMAQIISERWARRKQLIYAIVGEYHLAREHLPKEIYQLTGECPKVIHQNSEKLYFQWIEKRSESQVEVMRSQEGQFCVLSSPPWVRWQSYLIYLEKTHDKHLDFEGEELVGGMDYTDFVSSLVQFLAWDLELEISTDDLSVYSPVDQSYLEEILSEKVTADELEVIHWKMNNDRSFYLPQEGLVYLSRGAINHAAEMAGQYLHGKLVPRKRVFWNFPKDFIYSLWIEGMGYFMSKLINHRRKTGSIEDIRAMLMAIHPEDRGKEALQLSLDQRMKEILATDIEGLEKVIFKPKRKESYLESSRILGHMLGERLYINYREKKMGLGEFQELLRLEVHGEKFLEKYLDLQTRLKKRKSEIREGFV